MHHRLINGCLLMIMLGLTSCRTTTPTPPPLVWCQLAPLPDREGFAGAYAGVSGGSLIVAGGANFPGKKPWEKGQKVWYDEVFALTEPAGQWQSAGRLPHPLGYGVSVTVSAGVACVGGSDATKHHAVCFLLTLENGRARVHPLPPLPLPLANAGGAAIGDCLYICGGSDQPGEPSALGRLFALDLTAANPAWTELEPCPGRPRLLPVAAAVNGAFYLAGGADIVLREGKPTREYLTDAWRYQPGRGWQRIADLPKPSVAAPCPAPATDTMFYLAGGDDGSRVGFQPVEQHPGFPSGIRLYDTTKNEWRSAGETPAPRATLPCVFWQGRFVFPSGELRPGVRSPEVWTMAPARLP
jgi:N-acetylneuraminic acid mutarotase